jgi:hypothetical integral membrane protein (TIGR02206 family)
MNGFSIFDSIHLSWLVLIGLLLIISVYFYRNFSITNQQPFQRLIFWMLLLLEIVKQCYLLFTNQYSYWSPPLHLCGLGIFIIGWHAYSPNRTTATLLYALTLPGAAIALLFPGWTTDPIFGFLHIHSFLFHALLILFVLLLLVTKKVETTLTDLWRAILFLLLIVPPIYWYNAKFKTNFMFLNRPVVNTPLQWLFELFGASGYLLSLAVVICVLWLLLYLPFMRKIN